MTSEPPPEPSGARPGRDARRRALGLEGEGEAGGSTTGPDAERSPSTLPSREPLAASLARIPDLSEDEVSALAAAAAAPDASPEPASDGAVAVLAPPEAPAEAPAPEPSPADRASPTVEPVKAPRHDRHKHTSPPPKRPWWRRAIFALLLVGMVAAIPVCVIVGWEVIRDSQAGDLGQGSLGPTDPGYEAQVDPTPTAVAIQYDDEGVPNGATFMALGGSDGGGTVIFVPLNTGVTEPSFGVDTLRTSYAVVADRPTVARERLASQVGRLLNVGVDEIIDLGPDSWTQLVEPVAPLQIDNPDEVTLADGTVIPAGETELAADQVGPYLAAKTIEESDLNRLNRHAVVWEAWLDQVQASGAAGAVPGEDSAGIARFATALAAGESSFATLPVTPMADAPGKFDANTEEVSDLITDAVASPTAAVPGSRFTVRMLNGVSPSAIPSDLVRLIVAEGGAVTVLGNGPEFDTDETTVIYANPKMKDEATAVAKTLGASGKTRLDREAPDTVDLTIVLGRDLLGDDAGGDPGATTPAGTGGSGD